MRRAAVAVATTAMAVSLAACGSAKESGDNNDSSDSAAKKGDAIKVGLLLPENQTARYEKFDKPLIEKKVKELTNGKGEVVYANAKQDATLQAQQVDTMITNKVDVLIVDAVDSKAIAGSITKAEQADIPVVAYDRLAEGPIDAYTSFDNVTVGKTQGEALLEALGDKAKDGQIVMMNGSSTDPNAAQFKEGAHSVLDGKVKIGREYDTKEWKPENANANMEGAISAIGKDKIVGVYSANDGMAGGIITALKAAGISNIPVTGQDAELAGVQRIITGEQYMSVYKSYPQEAAVAGEMAVALAKGESLDSIAKDKADSATTKGIPSVLVPVVSLTKDNIKETVIKEGFYTLDEICAGNYKAACDKIGLK
ncbi:MULTISPECIES: sugar ABC transporter substrate-binding protein [Streptomyces]|uniref:Sugar ABC transporter substrate-binding protein n=3 Tax=Streptomyces rochei group TaxID=2867164 RepID=A0AAX3ZUL4_STRRO|nr:MULTISPECIES: sugar ABC transporter substrate-binding protein [Streptomyces]MBJ6621891.1 sugar ABC transporter substrate-binding protein [Streptomyces sp. DHE17-7]MBU8552454.1 sugar ABC transporter substrate-binding protein [Streptomyces sp. Osf17]MBU8559245.1 sugar ABC transporter substrate-binding protein [Streptomyces sp. Babs14]MBX4174812.1 sugar ABC transporter substrate-binding protein [Streptomyces geysiriensis]MCC8450762.1 sugar ABC transporter substrate-binding protein [Streptomyce